MARIDIYNLKDVPKSEIPKEGHKAYELYFDIIDSFGEPDHWLDDEEVMDVAKPVFDLIDILNKLNAKSGTKTKTKTKSKTTKKKSSSTSKSSTAKSKKSQTKKSNSRTKKKTKKARQVEMVDPQLTILRSFYLMTNKEVPRQRVLSLYKKIERFATERIIRKKDKYAQQIEDISRILADAFNSGDDPVRIDIPEDERQWLKQTAYSQRVRESVRIIKAFLSFLNKQDEERAEKLLIRINRALDNDKITDTDPYIDKIEHIKHLLENYLNKGKKITLTQSQLNGLGAVI